MPPKRNPAKIYSRAHRGRIGARVPLLELPLDGSDLPVPSMPAGRDWSETERHRWDELWRSPQATQWDEATSGTVAVLVAYESAVLAGTAPAWQAQEARYAADALGLTPKAMTALGWCIGPRAAEPDSAQPPAPVSSIERARQRAQSTKPKGA